MIFAVDFDGTCVEHEYPNVGREVEGCVECLKWLAANGHKIILWTMRSGQTLEDAVEWFRVRKIPLFGVNNNPEQKKWTTSPKAYAHMYIDDAAFGAPLKIHFEAKRPYINWQIVYSGLQTKQSLGLLNIAND